MAMDVGKKGGLNSDINVTPLVDVMLVLLIIMMLVAPMLQKGVPVTLPTANNTVQKPDNQEQTVLAIDSQNRFYVNGLEVSKTDMPERVKTVLEEEPQLHEPVEVRGAVEGHENVDVAGDTCFVTCDRAEQGQRL